MCRQGPVWAPSPVWGGRRRDRPLTAGLSGRLLNEDGVQRMSFSFLKFLGHLNSRVKDF